MRLILPLVMFFSISALADSSPYEYLAKCSQAISVAASNMSPVRIEKQPIMSSDGNVALSLADGNKLILNDEGTQILLNDKLVDGKQIPEAVEQFENGLAKIVRNLVAAIVHHAQQRFGSEPVDPKWGRQDYELDESTMDHLREIGCSCQSVKGLENATPLITRTLVSGPTPTEKLSFGAVKVWTNSMKSLVGDEEPKIRDLNATDLSCSNQ